MTLAMVNQMRCYKLKDIYQELKFKILGIFPY